MHLHVNLWAAGLLLPDAEEREKSPGDEINI